MAAEDVKSRGKADYFSYLSLSLYVDFLYLLSVSTTRCSNIAVYTLQDEKYKKQRHVLGEKRNLYPKILIQKGSISIQMNVRDC